MKTKSVPFSWIRRWGLRLDCGPYLSGAVDARIKMESPRLHAQRLRDVTTAIFHAGRESRTWVTDPKCGVPFLSSSDILKADLTDLPLLSKKQVERNPGFLIQHKWTLITRSGTIGRMVYVRPDMDGLACSEHAMRVAPDEDKIPPGYLSAFLRSRFGVPMVIGGTYGSIIQSIEPEHIADLPVPRLGDAIEQKAHELVEEAATLRVKASFDLQEAISTIEQALGSPVHPQRDKVFQVVKRSDIEHSSRLEAFFYNPLAVRVTQWAESHPNGHWSLSQVAQVYDVPPFKHIYVEKENGLPFYTSGELFKLDRKPEKYLSKTQTKGLKKYILGRGWVLLARSGQLGGIICRPQFSDSAMEGATTSDHVIRIIPADNGVPPGYLYAYLATPSVGYPLISKTISGSSVPALWPIYLDSLPVVKAPSKLMQQVNQIVLAAFEMRVQATQKDELAQKIVEQAIEEAA